MPSEGRPDPDAVLRKVQAEESMSRPGRLKIFFGYSAGVGKTYAMLAAARALEMKRGDVLVGYIEPHGRPETESLLLGLDIIPYKQVEYRGVTLREFDLDEALRRTPRLVLVDELAHTNAEGCRHAKRWQDVLELLDAGIDVYTTVNVQHIESLNDIVGKITGIVVREAVPDTVFDRADEIELVDLPPDELLERFREGKVYLPDQARRAADRFFKKETLVALRELTLRKTAEHVNRQVELGRRGIASKPIWATRERLMVAVGPSPTSARLIRATRRMATEMRCDWFAVAIEPSTGRTPEGVEANLRLAERLGAETVTIAGDRVARAVVAFAQDRGVTRIIVGKTGRPWWWRVTRGSIVDEITRLSGDIDVLVIRGDEAEHESKPSGGKWTREPGGVSRRFDTGVVTGAMAGATCIGLVLARFGIEEANIVLLFVLAVSVVAYYASRTAAVAAAVLAMLAFNFFFTRPYHTFAVDDPGYLVTFFAMIVIGLTVSALVSRVRAQADAAKSRADAHEALYRVGRQLAATSGSRQIAAEVIRLCEEVLDLDAAAFLTDGDDATIHETLGASAIASDERERAVASWALERGREAGAGTDTLAQASALHLPLEARGSQRYGVLAVRPRGERPLTRERARVVRSVVALAGQALEREALTQRARDAVVVAESERLRSDLLSTVSHDLRTPLAAIAGAASMLLHSGRSRLAPPDRDMLGDVIAESERLARLVENLLHLGRIDEGRAPLQAEWHSVDELIASAVSAVERAGQSGRIRVRTPADPLFCWADSSLVTQALINLIENAQKFAPEGEILVEAVSTDDGVRLAVTDRGPGFGEDRERLGGRFVRGSNSAASSTRGSGLGLAICRAVAKAHRGTLCLDAGLDGGARVTLDLPDISEGAPTRADAITEKDIA